MKKLLTLAAMLLALGMAALADPGCTVGAACNGGGVPEIDGSMASSAIALVSGALVMLRRKR